jgi:hypothetical protein
MLRKLLDDLDSDAFRVRQAAEDSLRQLGESAGPALREALKAKPPLDRRRRIEGLLAALDRDAPLSGESLRAARAVAVLERIGTAEARRALAELARGIESARLTRTAKDALARLKGR